MAKPKQIPSTFGYWPLLASEMKAFCAAWTGTQPPTRQHHRFATDWKKVATWGGSHVPDHDSQASLIFAVFSAATYRPCNEVGSAAKKRGFAGRVKDAFDEDRMKAAQIDVIRTSQFTAQTAFHAERFNWQQTPAGVPLPVFDFLVTLATFPDFTSAWLAYARQLLTNRSDKELVTRVWLHTNVWTTDPDRRGKWRQWTEDDFTHKDIARCIERDTEVRVSERTVRAVLSQMRAEERARTPMARVADRDIGS